jgi:hypothetical protein
MDGSKHGVGMVGKVALSCSSHSKSSSISSILSKRSRNITVTVVVAGNSCGSSSGGSGCSDGRLANRER